MVKKVGNLIIGKTTYDLMFEDKSFDQLNNPFIIILTSNKERPKRPHAVFAESFNKALNEAKKKKLKEVLVAGGGKADTATLESEKIDELYLDIEPHIFGKGIPLFYPVDMNLELQLLGTKRIGENGIQLHYQVIK